MSADIHRLGTEEGAVPLSAERSVYLDAYLAPFRRWLDRDTVTEIMVNRPGEVWIEDAADPGMKRIETPQIDDRLVQRLAEQVARVSHQGINREHPLLGATLPDGARVQFCGPPAARKHWVMAIRRHRRLDLPLDAEQHLVEAKRLSAYLAAVVGPQLVELAPGVRHALRRGHALGGRGGVAAEAILLFDPADIARMKRWLEAEENPQRAEVAWQRFLAMAAFAEAQICRRQVLLNYFGEARQQGCGNCDICLQPPQQFDGTELAQKALSCVYRVGQSFGMHHVIDVLRGGQNQKIVELQHDKLSTWGLGKDLSHDYWLSILRQLIHFGLLQQDITAHSVLKLQPAARPVLRGETALSLAVPRLQSVKREPQRLSKQQYDRALFAKLKALRKHIAARDDVAPFVVFSDASLIEMCQQLPTDNRSLLAISGVGQTKLSRYGADFIDAISDYLSDEAQPPAGKLAK